METANTTEREKKSLTTSSGTPYTIKAWLNKGEGKELLKFLSKHSKISDGGEVSLKIDNIEAMLDFNDKLVELYVVSINGKGNVMEVFNEMKEADAQEIQDFVMGEYQSAQKKTKTEPTNTGATSSTKTETSPTN